MTVVYVDHSRQVCCVDADGGQRRRLTEGDAAHAWPTWSPDGTCVAYSVVTSPGNGHRSISLLVCPLDGPAQAVYRNYPGTDAIAAATPHYIVWAPDDSKLAFFVQTFSSGLTLRVCDLASPEVHSKPVVSGAPLYASWSADSSYLLVHCG